MVSLNQQPQQAPDPDAGNSPQTKPGKEAVGEQWAVQTAQNTAVNDPEAIIPSDADVEKNRRQLDDYAAQEDDTLRTSDGFVIDEAGRIDNFAVEPPMRVETD